jgi:hypothetical protein
MDDKGFAAALRLVLESEARLLPDFRLEYHVVSGPRYGSAYEYEQTLRVEGGGRATLTRRRSAGDTDSAPAGEYRGEIPKAGILDMVAKLAAAPLHAIPMDVPSPTHPVFRLSVVAARKLFSFSWGPPAPPLPPELDAVFDLLGSWQATACPRPAWSLELEAAAVRFTGEGLEAEMRLRNTGDERIYVVHPASPGAPDRHGMSLRHGINPKAVPGITPPPMEVQFEELPLPPLTGTELVALNPGSPLSFTLRAPVTFVGGGGRVGIFGYHSYLHPDGAAGQPVFAGAVFSKETPL